MTKDLIVIGMAAGAIALPSCPKPAPNPTKATPISAAPAIPPTHDPNHPPIECPLAKQGIKTEHLRPFEDVEKYITFLERPDRALWQLPELVVEALALTGSETVVDIGAGSGYFSFRLAKALPSGQVIATDVSPEMVRHLHHKAMGEGIRNVRVALAKAEDPEVPADASLVFMCDVLHHIPDRAGWLGKLAASMRRGARLALLEFKEGKLPEGPPEDVKISKTKLVALVTGTGLVLVEDKPSLLPYQNFLIFKKP
jgi:SAM-dependent methyltransferase